MDIPNLLLRLEPKDEPVLTCRLPEFLRNNEEEYDGHHADIVAELIAKGEFRFLGFVGHYCDVTVIDPAEETLAERCARERAWRPLGNLCPTCAGRGTVYAGAPLEDGFHLSSREMERNNLLRLAGPFVSCPEGCKTPLVIATEAAALTREILSRRLVCEAA